MLEQKTGGHVVNVASMAGYVSGPGSTAYTASKFAVIGFSESLRAELREHGIGVTAVCPGVINTPIIRTSPTYGAAASAEYRERGQRLFERRNYGPERVARGILKAVARNRAIAPVTPEAWIGYSIKRLFPGLIALAGRASLRSMRQSPAALTAAR